MGPDELIDVVRRYDVPVPSSAIRSTLEREQQGVLLSEWAKTYLTADTLLTKDELNSYDTRRLGDAGSLLIPTGTAP